MYESIHGTLTYTSFEYFVLETGGVGYKLLIPFTLASHYPKLGEIMTLYTSFVVREDASRLFGFITREERDLFDLLISLSGIGPKTALSLIGHLPLPDLIRAVETDNTTPLTRIPGIGKKTAERIILELKDRIQKFSSRVKSSGEAAFDLVSDAKSALIHLGYNQSHAEKAIHKALLSLKEKNPPLTELITTALKNI